MAIAFLTRLPAPRGVQNDPRAFKDAAAWFPLVGLLIGGFNFAIGMGLRHALPSLVLAVLIVIADALVTGALHLDGLADMADGFGGGRSKEDVLRIMRDHAIGAYGAVAIALAVLLKVSCYAYVLNAWAFLLPCVYARWSVVWVGSREAYARSDASGTGAMAIHMSRKHLVIATILAGVLAAAQWRLALVCWAVALTVAIAIARWSRRRIGGITGDVLGATVVTSEAAQLLAAIALYRWT